jgi:hypothetical protein
MKEELAMDVFRNNEDRLDGLGQLRALLDADGHPPIGKTLAFVLAEVEKGRAVFEGIPGRECL